MAGFRYEFEWDPLKAETNFSKHEVEFDRAAGVFQDPLALTLRDEEHSADEERWITLGKERAGQYVLVVHTFEQLTGGSARVRLISARRQQARKSVLTRKSDETRV
jgi:uncharacterized protein